MKRTPRILSLAVFTCSLVLFASPGFAQYSRSDLVSNVKGLAAHTDTNLVNAWGIAFFPTSPIWVADEASGLSTLYDHQGKKLSLVVTIPSPSGVLGTPTGIVANGPPDFVVTKGGNSGPAFFIFDSEDGSISGWNPSVDPSNAVFATSVPGAFFTGLAIGNSGGKNFLFAADQANNVIDILDASFNVAGSFTDPAAAALSSDGWKRCTFDTGRFDSKSIGTLNLSKTLPAFCDPNPWKKLWEKVSPFDSDYNVRRPPFVPVVSDCFDSGGMHGPQPDHSVSG